MKEPSFEKKLASYVALASSILAANAGKVDAQIIYTDVNPDLVINNDTCILDLNNDGIVDFTLSTQTSWSGTTDAQNGNWEHSYRGYFINCKTSNSVLVDTIQFPDNLSIGDTISNSFTFYQNKILYRYSYFGHSYQGFWSGQTGENGNWNPPSEKYLGLKFKIDSETHYGWARIKIDDNKLTLFGYAYNVDSNEQVLAGEWDVLYKPVSVRPDIDTVLISINNGELQVFDKKLEYYRGDLRIYDAIGKLVFVKEKINSEETISIANFLPGTYFAQLIQASNQYYHDAKPKIAVQSFIVSH